jgi:hypothetical protein
METMDLTQSFMTALARAAEKQPSLELCRKKVNKLLGGYALRRGYESIDGLLLIDVCGDVEYLHRDLQKHINGQKMTESYKQSQTSNVRRLVKTVTIPASLTSSTEPIAETVSVKEHLPEFLRPYWGYFDREGTRRFNTRTLNETLAERESLPLTVKGEKLLKAILLVSKEKNIEDIESLLVNNWKCLCENVKESCEPREANRMRNRLNELRSKLGYAPGKLTYSFLKLEDLPEKLREQVNVFLDHAPRGLQSIPLLEEFAKRFGIERDAIKPSTLRLYKDALLRGLSYIPLDETISIETLLSLQPIERHIAGRMFTELHNPLVDTFRSHEREKTSERKRQYYDSTDFHSFKLAIMSVGLYNGFVELIEPFSKTYKLNRDRVSNKERKTEKKQLFDRPWLDSEIERLRIEFDLILKRKSFRIEPGKRSKESSMRALRLCLFVTWLVTLRFTGFRQQCLRNCRLGENIIFHKDASLTFQWPAGQIKNRKKINTTFSAGDHRLTHGTLLHVLNNYRDVIYPYLEKNCGEQMRGQFFVTTAVKTLVRCFQDTEDQLAGAVEFSNRFSNWAAGFMDFDGRLSGRSITFNPHIIRAIATDWMMHDLQMTIREIAKSVGDTEKTLMEDYIEEDRVIDPASPFKRINKRLRQEALEAASQEADLPLPSLQSEVRSLRAQLEMLEEQIKGV